MEGFAFGAEEAGRDALGAVVFDALHTLAWHQEIKNWAGRDFDAFHLEGSFRLSYNGSIFAKAGLGYLLTFDKLIDVSSDSGLVFRPLTPCLETKLYLVWKKYQPFTPIAERFLEQVKASFGY